MQAIVSVHYRLSKRQIEDMPLSEITTMYEWLTWFKRKEAEAANSGNK